MRLRPGTTLGVYEIDALFDVRGLHLLNPSYDVARDGRFVMIKGEERPQALSPIKVIANWTATLLH
jgi:hypothetical protein